ncbi:hypothetical protein FSB08_27205 [Paraburkholderia sp. JPY432]|uniref:hypothetical protein n=1 Tax=Paraburkholderia youngii TaxID=2782701 RepID=UPI001595D075|nr:hypothetical protein [Paraburkholderia youngii]NVH76114.1 hypothetical protein [Paraburkholderia youngii]
MKKKINLPAGMIIRPGRGDGPPAYYVKSPSGKRIWLPDNFQRACLLCVELQKGWVKQARPSTALGLLTAFQKCSLILSKDAAIRMRAELAILRRFFADHNDPPLDAITSEGAFVIWYMARRRAAQVGDVIGLFRHIWLFALDLEICNGNCPWKPFDLTNAREKMEAVDIMCSVSTAPLKALLEELLGNAGTTATEQTFDPAQPQYRHYILGQLRQAAAAAVETLRACGRTDPIVAVYQLTLDDLLGFRGSPVLPLIRPPGRILLKHRRKEQLNLMRSQQKASRAEMKTDRLHDDSTTSQAADAVIVTPANSLEEKR